MNRVLPPLTRKRRLGPTDVSFPLTMRSETSVAVLIAAPRRAVAAALATPRLRPVPLAPRQGGLVLSYASWTETPVGPYAEVTVLALAYHGVGSPVPGLAPLLHGAVDRSRLVGDYGYVPVVTLVDAPDAASFRRDLWHVPAAIAPIRSRHSEHRTVVQAEHDGHPLLRLAVDHPPRHGTARAEVTLPLFGTHEGTVWCDVGGASFERFHRRVRLGNGQAGLYALGPLEGLGSLLGASPDDGFVRRVIASEIGGEGRIRWAGPRPVEPDDDPLGDA